MGKVFFQNFNRKPLRKEHEMISRWKWTKLDWLLVIALALIILFVVAGNSGAATFAKGALHLVGSAFLWAGNALNAVGR